MSSTSDAPSTPAAGPPPGSPPDVTGLFGPLLIGVLLNTLLYGIMVVQAYLYFHRYKSDRTWFKVLVAYLVIVETVNLLCVTGIVYEPLVIRYATMQALVVSPIMLRSDAILTVLCSFPTQIFIAWRVQVITKSYLLASAIALLALVAFGGGISVTAIVTIFPDFASFPNFKPEVMTWLIASSACDVLLTASLVFSLWKRKTSMVGTDSYINKIIRLTVQTGMITATAATLDMLLYILIPHGTYNFIIDFPLSKLYTNSLISTLNARPWREAAVDPNMPNVLFEQTARSGGSGMRATGTAFGMVQRGGKLPSGQTFPTASPTSATFTASNSQHTNPSADSASFFDMASSAHYVFDIGDGERERDVRKPPSVLITRNVHVV
ncbi:hypothetical protein MKEN_00833300 [Mycena kentingensis (nom. inval.)]|nr:hypothetical protein MKEN_00833300 [Mycena kentingensis (nom. inval.)]